MLVKEALDILSQYYDVSNDKVCTLKRSYGHMKHAFRIMQISDFNLSFNVSQALVSTIGYVWWIVVCDYYQRRLYFSRRCHGLQCSQDTTNISGKLHI